MAAAGADAGGGADVKALIRGELSELERKGLTKEVLMQRLAQQEERLRAVQRYQPDLFAPLWATVPQEQQTQPADTGGSGAGAGAGPTQRGPAWDWEQAMQRDRRLGEEGGLVDRGTPGFRYCPCCEQDVADGACERHIESNRHRRSRHTQEYMETVAEKKRNGELDPWISIRNGVEYCTLCWNYATEAHLESSKHIHRVANHFSQMGVPQASGGGAGAIGVPSGAPAAGGAPAQVDWTPVAPVLPADWGSPEFYEWKQENGCFYCRLCWRNADESHVYSDRHQKRMANPEPYLKDPADAAAQPALPAPELAAWVPPASPWATPWPAGHAWGAPASSPPQAVAASPAAPPPYASAPWASAAAPAPCAAPAPGAASSSAEPWAPVVAPAPCAAPAQGAASASAEPAAGAAVSQERVAVRDWAPSAGQGGYISLRQGEAVVLLYEGASGEELGWSYGSCGAAEGWFPTDAVAARPGEGGVWL